MSKQTTDISDEIKEQKKKLKDMTLKQKIQYLWYYYRIHALVTILVLIFGTYFVHEYRLAQRANVFGVVFINSEIAYPEDSFQEGYNKFIGIDDTVTTSFDTSSVIKLDSSDTMTISCMQKIIGQVQAEQLDVIMANSDLIDYYAYNEFLGNIEEMLPADLIQKYKDDNLIYYAKQEDGTELPVGIYIKDSVLFNKQNIYNTEPAILSVVVNTPHIENIVAFIEYLYQDN